MLEVDLDFQTYEQKHFYINNFVKATFSDSADPQIGCWGKLSFCTIANMSLYYCICCVMFYAQIVYLNLLFIHICDKVKVIEQEVRITPKGKKSLNLIIKSPASWNSTLCNLADHKYTLVGVNRKLKQVYTGCIKEIEIITVTEKIKRFISKKIEAFLCVNVYDIWCTVCIRPLIRYVKRTNQTK